jgi:arginine decarboxylase
MTDHYSALQLRADEWSALREAMDALEREQGQRATTRLTSRIQELFDGLAPIEGYWAFPGISAFNHLRRQFETGNIADAAFTVRRIKRAMSSGAYRRRTIPLDRDDAELEDHEEEALLSPEARALAKPYFEVLFVDALNDPQERWLRNSIHGMRRGEDAFHYEPLVDHSTFQCNTIYNILTDYKVFMIIQCIGIAAIGHLNTSHRTPVDKILIDY